jgi:hypothetical protein
MTANIKGGLKRHYEWYEQQCILITHV